VNAAGVASAASASVSATPSPAEIAPRAATISPVDPIRVADTRRPPSDGVPAKRIGHEQVFKVTVSDTINLAPSEIEAVALNVTLTDTVAGIYGGFATVFPCGPSIPDASSLNFTSGMTIATGVLSATNDDGDICIYLYGEAHVIVDVTGVVRAGIGYHSFAPRRQTDTRRGSDRTVAQPVIYSSLEIQLTEMDKFGLDEITAISATLTVTSTVAPPVGGFATVYACDSEPPDASTLNFVTNQTVANSFISPISENGKLCVYIYGEADVIVDINGAFTVASEFSPVQPTRITDTRRTAAIGTLTTNATDLVVPIHIESHSVLNVDTTVTLNITAVGTTAPDVGGFLTVYPCGARPDTSTLNFRSGQIIANSVVTPVSANGTICVYVYGKADVLIDVNGISQAQ